MAYAVDIRRERTGALCDIRGAAATVAAMLGRLDLRMPVAANTGSGNGDLELFWVGPQRWLLRSAADPEWHTRVAGLAGDPRVSVVDVSDGYTMFAITGADAAEILAQASPLDVHPSAFPGNGASFTEFFGQTALIVRRNDGFLIAVESSYADFVGAWLERARGEHSLGPGRGP